MRTLKFVLVAAAAQILSSPGALAQSDRLSGAIAVSTPGIAVHAMILIAAVLGIAAFIERR